MADHRTTYLSDIAQMVSKCYPRNMADIVSRAVYRDICETATVETFGTERREYFGGEVTEYFEKAIDRRNQLLREHIGFPWMKH